MVKIGVILNQEKQITSLINATKVAIYEKKDSNWIKTCEIKECFGQRDSMNQMRKFLSQLMRELKDCKILIASILTGIPFMILDKEGFMLCEAEELSERLLEEIAIDYEKTELRKVEQKTGSTMDYPIAPFETNEKGVFELDMRKLQECHPEISSKKAIIPFLTEGKFYHLSIYCSHVMPWLDTELTTLGFQYISNRIEGQGYQVDIERTCCDLNIF